MIDFFLGLGVFDAGYYAQLQVKNASLTHQVVRYKEETYTRDMLGFSQAVKINRFISVTPSLSGGYEYHYESNHYAKSYFVAIPEVGITSNHDYISTKIMWTPAKYFVKLSREKNFRSSLFRVEPSVSIGVSVNLNHTLWIPKPLNTNHLRKKTTTKTTTRP